jgi:sterol desaturase/sphingolipid hydroxylase (fatty acid hydroxylase superfamily)
MQTLLDQFGTILTSNAIRYFIIAGIPFFVFYILHNQKFSKSKIQNREAGRADFMHEIAHSIFTSVIFSIISLWLLYTPIKKYTLVYDNINDYPFWWIPVGLILSLLIHDTYFYWMHRLLHHKKLFRHAHLVHHKSTNPSPWSSYSFHFFESIFQAGVLVVLVFCLPMHFVTIILFVLVSFIINVYGHLGFEIMPRSLRHSFIFKIINTSVHHNLHHSKFNGNYGLYLRFWDRICNTEHPDYVKEYDRIQRQRFPDKDK